jgi:hypothetical protein
MSDTGSDDIRRVHAEQLRRDITYATAVLDVAKRMAPPPPPPSVLARFLGFMSSGLGLLLIGSLITSILVPYYQRASEQRQAERSIMRECFAEFLQYEVSIWREYYAVFPLIHDSEIDRKTYDEYMAKISDIKLDRYSAYGKVKALAIAFRESPTSFALTNLIRGEPESAEPAADASAPSDIEALILDYAIELNRTSEKIDAWLGALYCARSICADGQSGVVSSKAVIDDLAVTMDRLSDMATSVSERIVRRIQGFDAASESAPVDALRGPART